VSHLFSKHVAQPATAASGAVKTERSASMTQPASTTGVGPESCPSGGAALGLEELLQATTTRPPATAETPRRLQYDKRISIHSPIAALAQYEHSRARNANPAVPPRL